MHFETHFRAEHFVHYEEPSNGSWHRHKWEDIAHCKTIKRIQYNTQKFKKYLIIDIDIDYLYAYKYVIPEPNFIVKNKDKNGAHLFYVLNKTINEDNKYYLKIWKELEEYFSEVCLGDPCNKGFIGKNFNNNVDFEYIELHQEEYSINYLMTYLPENRKVETSKEHKANIRMSEQQSPLEKIKVDSNTNKILKNRNVQLFDIVRKFAYAEIKRGADDNEFTTIIEKYAKKQNNAIPEPLDSKELANIVKSVKKYCIQKKSQIKNSKNRNVMNLDESLELKQKQKLSAEYSAKVKINKTQETIKDSILEMQEQNLKISGYSLQKYTKLSKNTIRKYKYLLE